MAHGIIMASVDRAICCARMIVGWKWLVRCRRRGRFLTEIFRNALTPLCREWCIEKLAINLATKPAYRGPDASVLWDPDRIKALFPLHVRAEPLA